jgi:hypothetical protein
MAQSPNRNQDDRDRARDEEMPRGIMDEDVSGRADADQEEFEDLEDLDEEEDEYESER